MNNSLEKVMLHNIKVYIHNLHFNKKQLVFIMKCELKSISGYSIIFSIFLLLGILGSIRFLDDNDYVSDVVTLHANIDNRKANDDIDNAKVKYVFLDNIDIRGSSRTTEIHGGDVGVKVVSTYVRDYGLAPGEYMVRVYAYGDDGKRDIKHRVVVIE